MAAVKSARFIESPADRDFRSSSSACRRRLWENAHARHPRRMGRAQAKPIIFASAATEEMGFASLYPSYELSSAARAMHKPPHCAFASFVARWAFIAETNGDLTMS